jgi:hypothetical protein
LHFALSCRMVLMPPPPLSVREKSTARLFAPLLHIR